MDAYCFTCKAKRNIQAPQADYTATGKPATRGICPVCGNNLFRMGRTEAHTQLPPPVSESVVKSKRSGKLVIVESPAKARTVGRFLGKGYVVKASVGHVRDLLRSQLSVDVENDFAPKYRVPNEKKPIVKEIIELVKKAEEVYLATDPDREGEAIAWHLMQAANISETNSRRVVFHEITEPAVVEAFKHARELNMDLVDAQQARRVLDRLVGYNLSPLLWRKIRGRLSAGRVQSVALRLIVERDREIEAFIPVEYWSLAGEFSPQGSKEKYIARLIKVDDQDPGLTDEEAVSPLLADMQQANYSITKIKRGERKRNPSAPFTTSTLQQEASRKLGFTARRTMALAQQLYEGIDVGQGGSVGLITYMRTDSTNISELAQQEARQFIADRYGESFMPPQPPKYKTKTRGAQEAHEAIRPSSVLRQPETIKEFLGRDQFRLYQLIWKRFVASQMSAAAFDTMTVEITATTSLHQYFMRASGSVIRFQGFLVVYEETVDEDLKLDDEETRLPPNLAEGQIQRLVRLIPEQHFTQPPPRFSEATLVRTLEENGIGRPSTYAPILATLQQRNYVVREATRLIPTETGILVNDVLTEHFPEVVDVGFTAHMEEDLDLVAAGELPWVEVIREFYAPFSEQVAQANENIPVMNMGPEPIGRACPKCGNDLVIRWGRYGKFISCSGFPNCRYTEPWLEKIGVTCRKDGGEIVERKTRKNRVFYGCANYPICDFTSWKKPLATACPNCSGMLVVADKRNAQCLNCQSSYPLDDVVIEEVAAPAQSA